jgi:carnitine 3-dehydrogenase
MSEVTGHVAVVGTGTVGASWAAYFLARGLDVVATDPGPDAEATLRRLIHQDWPALEALGLAPGASPDRVRFVTGVAEAVDGAGWVQESAPEREELKIELLAAIDAACPPEVVVASSSSGLLISRIVAGTRHPERCVIGHPFNPPHLMPLVEVVGGAETSEAVVDAAMDFYRAIGKHPIRIRREVVGHVANRIQAAIFREALHLLKEGVASVTDIDAAVRNGPGIRWALMGPFLVDHLAEPYNTWFADLGQPMITPEDSEEIIEGVRHEVAGRPMADLVAKRDEALVQLLSSIEPL